MLRHKIIPIPKKILLSPIKLLCYISYQIFAVHLKSVAGVFLSGIIGLSIAIAIATGMNLYVNITLYLLGFTILVPLVISLEEFFHSATCIARGKVDSINNLIIGYFEKNNRNFSFIFAAVGYYGKFNLMDKFYISAGGPVTTAYLVVTITVLSFILRVDRHIVTILFLNAFIPFIGLIPSNFIIQSDGYNIREVSQKLNMPWYFIILYMVTSTKYSIKYCFSHNKNFKDEFLNPPDVLEKIEKLIEDNKLYEAITHYNSLLKIDPFNALYYNNIAWLYYMLGELNKAMKYSKKSLKLSSFDEDFKDTFEKIRISLNRNVELG